MKQLDFEIKDNNKIADNIFKMRLMGDISGITPGQFAAWYSEDGEMLGSGPIKE